MTAHSKNPIQTLIHCMSTAKKNESNLTFYSAAYNLSITFSVEWIRTTRGMLASKRPKTIRTRKMKLRKYTWNSKTSNQVTHDFFVYFERSLPCRIPAARMCSLSISWRFKVVNKFFRFEKYAKNAIECARISCVVEKMSEKTKIKGVVNVHFDGK